MGCHSLLQGIFLTPGIEPGSPVLQADSLLSEPPGKPPLCGEAKLKNKIKCTGNSLENTLIRILHFSWPGPRVNPWWVSKATWRSQKRKNESLIKHHCLGDFPWFCTMNKTSMNIFVCKSSSVDLLIALGKISGNGMMVPKQEGFSGSQRSSSPGRWCCSLSHRQLLEMLVPPRPHYYGHFGQERIQE